jgi:flagellar motor switch protein FliG
MSLERYLKDDDGFRKYVELMESTPTAKRQSLMEAARKENAAFVDAAEKCLLTFDRITRLPEMELAEVLGANDLKPEIVAVAILSVPDLGLREQLTKSIPRASANNILLELKDRGEPKPAEVGGARLQLIKKARELEKAGKLASVQMPRFRSGHFAA